MTMLWILIQGKWPLCWKVLCIIWKESLNTGHQQCKQYKKIEQPSQIIEHKKDRDIIMQLEIQAWDRHTLWHGKNAFTIDVNIYLFLYLELCQVLLPAQNKNCWSSWHSEIFDCFFYTFAYLKWLWCFKTSVFIHMKFIFIYLSSFSKLIPTILSISIYNYDNYF